MIRSTGVLGCAVLLTACAGGWWPFGGKSADPAARIPPGATEYRCADNKRLLVRHTTDGKTAWVIYPDREFRLDRVAGAGGDRYTNGISTLSMQGEEVMLEESGSRLFNECKRSQAN